MVFVFLVRCEDADGAHVMKLEEPALAIIQLDVSHLLWLAVFLIEEACVFCNSCVFTFRAAQSVGCNDFACLHRSYDGFSVVEVEIHLTQILIYVHKSYFIRFHFVLCPSGTWGLYCFFHDAKVARFFKTIK